ncbi:MAG: nitrate reductase cytochrome c-type subunit [Candidatus Competibacterales bacterium]|nr:nitrate reductase cytochrome c-type subunit [Candidatus Competibacterales bacterium]
MKPHAYILLGVLLTGPVLAQDAAIATLRGAAPIDEQAEPPRMPQVETRDGRRQRDYPMQPPTIPHEIDDYQVDLNANKCLSCHSRREVAESQAPMVSVTHYMDRDGNFLAEVSPRRYFCNQCHVPQTEARPLVENTFEDVDQIIARQRQADQQ